MIERLLPALARPGHEQTTVEAYYECTCCRAVFDEWPADCPACGQLVVRIVVPPT